MTPLQKNILAACKHRPQTLRELQNALQVDNSRLRNTVTGMVATGMLSARNGTYVPGFAVMENTDAPAGIPCTLVKLAARFGFASRDDGTGDIFIPGRALHGAMPQDKIIIKLFDHPRVEGSAEGEVVEVTTPHNTFAGTIVLTEDGRLAVEPDGCRDVRIVLDKKGVNGAQLGDKVGAILTNRGQRHMDHRCAVAERFGTSDRAAECAKAVLYGRDVRQEFPEEVLAEAHAYDNALIDPAEAAHRADLRGLPIFTIDSAETKDIDDAISLMKTQNGGYELGVHIADVSHYVRPDTALDKEAYERATSIYYADKVIPMLPTQLSNGICSLNEGEERLAFSCLMQLDESGNIHSYQFVKSVIRSRVKGVYKEINALLDGSNDPALVTKYKDVMAQLPAMTELYEKRLALRKARGAMDIESDEAKLVMDEEGRCVDIVKRTRGVSECMIEEFMLLANRKVAEFVGRKRPGVQNGERTFVYRIHDKPNSDKLSQLRSFVLRFGYQMKSEATGKALAKDINKLMKNIHGKQEENLISTLAIRTMAKATYSTDNIGHYGLAFDFYTHFTSPIRRYPDMMVHRLLAHYLAGGKSADKTYYEEQCEHSSAMEVRAADAERASIKYKMVEFMLDKIDQEFDGHISGVTEWGIYVELDDTKIEGMVSVRDLTDDYYVFDVESYALRGERTGRAFTLGDGVRIKVLRADLMHKQLDFALTATYDFETKQATPVLVAPAPNDAPAGSESAHDHSHRHTRSHR